MSNTIVLGQYIYRDLCWVEEAINSPFPPYPLVPRNVQMTKVLSVHFVAPFCGLFLVIFSLSFFATLQQIDEGLIG